MSHDSHVLRNIFMFRPSGSMPARTAHRPRYFRSADSEGRSASPKIWCMFSMRARPLDDKCTHRWFMVAFFFLIATRGKCMNVPSNHAGFFRNKRSSTTRMPVKSAASNTTRYLADTADRSDSYSEGRNIRVFICMTLGLAGSSSITA